MGVFGSINTAVSGLRAQAFALENISGNIANSQTTGFKRQDTSFFELVSDSADTQADQNSGSVRVASRSTNEIQGNITASDVSTNVAINGDGYFVVERPTSFTNGEPVFTGDEFYTRAGDFALSSDNFLENGSGFFLEGFPLDGNNNVNTSDPRGSTPIQVSRDPLPPVPTTEINFEASLPIFPATSNFNPDIANSELLDPSLRTAAPGSQAQDVITLADNQAFLDTTLPGGSVNVIGPRGIPANVEFRFAKTETEGVTPIVPGTATIDVGAADGIDLTAVAATDTLDITVGGATLNVVFNTGTVPATVASPADLASAINNAVTDTGFAQNLVASVDANGDLALNSSTGDVTAFVFTDVSGAGADDFTGPGTGDGAFNADFDAGGIPTQDIYNLYYRTDTTSSLTSNPPAAGTTPIWQRIDQQYVFDSGGQLATTTPPLILNDFTINGLNVGNVTFDNDDGFIQVATANGSSGLVSDARIGANGSPLGEFRGVNVTDGGIVSISYSNGATVDVAEIAVVTFDNDAGLQRVDGGGTFAATASSGAPTRGSNTVVDGGALEASNTDIADEFTKLIVTQQAYTANSRVITTADELLSETINIIR